MPVSESDRAYFTRIGEYKRRSHEDAQTEHLALSMAERLDRSWRLHQRCTPLPDGKRDDEPGAFYERARALGLYVP